MPQLPPRNHAGCCLMTGLSLLTHRDLHQESPDAAPVSFMDKLPELFGRAQGGIELIRLDNCVLCPDVIEMMWIA